jgi:DNA replication and repair protein RecF
MHLRQLRLRNFRGYSELVLHPDEGLPDGLIAISGPNGFGKTNLVEAVAFLSRVASFRGAPNEALVRRGEESAVIRAEIVDGERVGWIEIEIQRSGRTRVLVNRQRATRRQTLEALPMTVFSPADLDLVQGPPSERRDAIDDAVVALEPRHERLRSQLERVLRQRNALLRSCKGRLDESAALTLEVWDNQLIEAAHRWGDLRLETLDLLRPFVRDAYRAIASSEVAVGMDLSSEWRADGLAAFLERGRNEEIRRGTTLWGPHRDDVVFTLDGLTARTHASQGEQRSLAIAFRLAVHVALTEQLGSPPVLILDDVLSELDPRRRESLIANMPMGQVMLTSAGDVPDSIDPALTVTLVGRAEVAPLPGCAGAS